MDELSRFLYERYVSRFKSEAAAGVRPLSANDRRWLAWRVLPLLAGVPRTGRILELGCGPGQLLGFLRDQGFGGCRGVDLSAEQVALARAAGLEVRQADLFEELRAGPHDCDAIIAVDVLEHVERDRLLEFGRLCHRALRPGGLLIVQTPNGEGVHAGHVIHGDLTHRTIFNESSLRQYLRALDFTDIVVRETAPVPVGLKGVLRWLAWQLVRGVAICGTLAETGRRPRVLTQELLAAGRTPAASARPDAPCES